MADINRITLMMRVDTEQSLRRVRATVSPLWPEFSFIEGFK